MKKKFRSLKIDLIVDLSLLTLCALLLSEALMIVLLRIQLPASFETTAQLQLPSLHREFISRLKRPYENSEKLSEQFQVFMKARVPNETPPIQLYVDKLPEDLKLSMALKDGEVVALESRLGFFAHYTHAYVFPISSEDGVNFTYVWSLEPLQGLLTNFKYRVFLITILIEVLLVLLAYKLLFKRNILLPIQNLSEVSKEFLNENWAARCNFERQDELGSIATALNEMAQKIQDRERKLVLTIESLKSANEELEIRQNEQLQIEKLASIGRLAAGVAHEVGNPLGAISGYVDILRRSMKKLGTGSSEDVDLCDRIEAETNRISKIIRALLQQARPTKERIRAVVLKPVLVRCVSLAQIPPSIDVEYDFQDQDATVSAEEDQLVQVFLNLLVNAKHAIEAKVDRKEAGMLRIRCSQRKLPLYRSGPAGESDYDTSVVRALKPEVYWVVSIEDNGIGISDEDQKKLFEPFFSTKAPGRGTGLGLYVAKSIVESFRGALILRSAFGFGASFSVFLPCAKSTDQFIRS